MENVDDLPIRLMTISPIKIVIEHETNFVISNKNVCQIRTRQLKQIHIPALIVNNE